MDRQPEQYAIVSTDAWVLATPASCWKCREAIEIICVYCEEGEIHGETYAQFTLSNITAIDSSLARQLAPWPFFRFGYSKSAGGVYLLNHCSRCGIPQGDYFLHCEPEGALFAPAARAREFRATRLEGPVRLTGDEGFAP